MYEGLKSAKVLFISDYLRPDEKADGVIFSEARKNLLIGALNRAGITEDDYAFTVIHPAMPKGMKISGFSQEEAILSRLACKTLINESKANVLVPLGDYALKFITGLESADKQKCSILKVKAEFGSRKAVPLPHPEYIQRDYAEHAYLSIGCRRIKEEMDSPVLSLPSRKVLLSLDLSFEQIIAYLESKVLTASELSVDVESGNGIVNTQGFAISPVEAIAVEVSPSRWTPVEFKHLWDLIAKILESENIKKIGQNLPFESQWASLYGIDLKGCSFDTQWAMKLLHPTLNKGLDNVARIYTRRPYWKDDHSDWNNIRNWRDHLTYNASDTMGTFEAKVQMERDLEQRGMLGLFESYMSELFPIVQRVTARGLLVDEARLSNVRANIERDLQASTESLDLYTETKLGRKINTNSPKQVKDALVELGMKVPTKAGKATIAKDALIKMRKQHPKDPFLIDLIKVNKLGSDLDKYFNFTYDHDKRVRFSVDPVSNEYGEWSSSENPFGSGFSVESLPKKTKEFIVAEPGKTLLEISFRNPEFHILAYDSGDSKMIGMIDRFESIPRYIASKMFNKPQEIINDRSQEFRLAEKAVLESAYGTTPRAFATKMMGELGFSMTEIESNRYLKVITENFPNLFKRQIKIQDQIRRTRRLTNALNRSITYYDRINDDLFKQAYQWPVRSLIADIKNHLMGSISDIVAVTDKTILVELDSEESAYEMSKYIEDNEWQPKHLSRLNSKFKIGTVWGGLADV